MIRNIFIFLLANFLLLLAKGQNTNSISGFIFDAESREILIGAAVYEMNSGQGTVSNAYGYYSLVLDQQEQYNIQVSYVGYQTQLLKREIKGGLRLDIFLKPGIDLDEITISANRHDNFTRAIETGVVRLPMREVKMMPNLFGEVDIIKAFQLTPGVQSGGEAKSELYVRGGSPDQNLIILDDVPLYYVAHFGGFFSIFNADAINDVKLVKGGFPARYGGRLSSVLDVRMKDGNMMKLQGQGTVGLLSSKLMLEGPLVNNRSSFMISGRKNLLPVFRFFGTDLSYNFYDLNAKLNYKLSEKDRIFLSFYSGDDMVKTKSESYGSYLKSGSNWGNLVAALRYNRFINTKLFGNLTIAYTKYRYINEFENQISADSISKAVNSKLLTGIADLIVKADMTYQVSSNYQIRFGASGIYHRITPNNETYSLIFENQELKRAHNSLTEAFENAIYTEHELSNDHFGLNAGLRAVNFLLDKKAFNFLEPRININVPLRHDLSVNGSYAITNQFMHLLSYSGTGMPADYWMPSTKTVKPSRSKQFSLGLAKTFGSGLYKLSIEAYHKVFDGMIAFKPGASLIGNFASWENVIEKDGTGMNYGLELFLQKNLGKSTGWAGITLSKAERQFRNLNEGKSFPFKYDRLVDISMVWNYEISESIIISTTWTYGSGYPVTLASEHYYIEGEEVFVYDKLNSFRMRDYHRLDFAINFPKKISWGERTWTISVFNLYNRQNPYYYYYDRKILNVLNAGAGQNPIPIYDNLRLYQKSLFSFFPSFSYSFKF